MKSSRKNRSNAGLTILEVALALAIGAVVMFAAITMLNAMVSLNTYSGVTNVAGSTVPFAPSQAMGVQAAHMAEQIRVDGSSSLYVIAVPITVPSGWGGQSRVGGTVTAAGRMPFLASATSDELASISQITSRIGDAVKSVGGAVGGSGWTVFFVGSDQVLVSCIRVQVSNVVSDDGIPITTYSVFRETSVSGVWQQTEGYTFAEKQGLTQFIPQLSVNTDGVGAAVQGRSVVFSLPDPMVDVAEMNSAGASPQTMMTCAFPSP